MDMHEFARRLGAAKGSDPLFEALDALRYRPSPILEEDTTDAAHSPRGWSTWSEPGMPDPDPADRERVVQDR